MKAPLAAAGLTAVAMFAADSCGAATAYVTDQLVLNVYAAENGAGQRLATLRSGASVETLAVAAESTQVRLSDGQVGWVKSSYLTAQVPAVVRIKQLEDELDRDRATTPELAQAASRSELARLETDLADARSELDAVRADQARRPAAGAPRPPAHTLEASTAALDALLCAGLGFGAGYVTLARRVRRKFGGLKVY